MKKGLTEMVFIIDKSGSMEDLVADTIGGFQSLIKEQKKVNGEARVTVVLFNDQVKKLYDRVDITKVKKLTEKQYTPFGSTALLDAIGLTVDAVGEEIADTPEEEHPESVIVAIITDGQENSSHLFTKDQIKEKIRIQTDVYKWSFLFVGANMDAIAEAGAYGISESHAATYAASGKGTRNAYGCVSQAVQSVRENKALDESWKDNILPE